MQRFAEMSLSPAPRSSTRRVQLGLNRKQQTLVKRLRTIQTSSRALARSPAIPQRIEQGENEQMKKIAEFGSVVVRGRNACGEYEVKQGSSIYYTDDKQDAIDTAKYIASREGEKGASK